MTTIAKIPQNQQDAMPLLSIGDATAPDSIDVVGSTIIKYWGPGSNGITGAMGSIGTGVDGGIVGNFLDLRGMTQYMFVLVRNVGDAAAEANAQSELMVQARAGGQTGYFDASNSLAFNSNNLRLGVASFPLDWALLGAGFPYKRSCIRGFSNNTPNSGSAPSTNGCFIGSDCRFILEFGGVAGGANLTWSMHIYAQGP